MSYNKRETYDSSESSSDSESDNEEIQPQSDEQNFPSLSLVDDEQPVLHIPNFEGGFLVHNIYNAKFNC
jgi:hypothetical protein